MNGTESTPSKLAGRPIRIVASVVLVVIATVSLLGAISISTISYALPARPGSDVLSSGTAVWGPGVAAAVLAGLVLLGSVSWLVWNARSRPSQRYWLLACGIILATFVLVFAVARLPTPNF